MSMHMRDGIFRVARLWILIIRIARTRYLRRRRRLDDLVLVAARGPGGPKRPLTHVGGTATWCRALLGDFHAAARSGRCDKSIIMIFCFYLWSAVMCGAVVARAMHGARCMQNAACMGWLQQCTSQPVGKLLSRCAYLRVASVRGYLETKIGSERVTSRCYRTPRGPCAWGCMQ
jgi:hypothetical protein